MAKRARGLGRGRRRGAAKAHEQALRKHSKRTGQLTADVSQAICGVALGRKNQRKQRMQWSLLVKNSPAIHVYVVTAPVEPYITRMEYLTTALRVEGMRTERLLASYPPDTAAQQILDRYPNLQVSADDQCINSDGALFCTLSHAEGWLAASTARNRANLCHLFLEDDAKPVGEFVSRLRQLCKRMGNRRWDVLLLYRNPARVPNRSEPSFVRTSVSDIVQVFYFHCTCAYVVSSRGLSKLRRLAQTVLLEGSKPLIAVDLLVSEEASAGRLRVFGIHRSANYLVKHGSQQGQGHSTTNTGIREVVRVIRAARSKPI
jgi:hypothetical protein